jgi:uncharacterized protein (DUF1501 family)
MLSRRAFLKRSSLIALAPTVPAFLAQTARAAAQQNDGRVLVVIQLDGGNDGINTVVPFADEGYARARKQLRLPANRLLKINDQVGLHPAMRGAGKLLESGRLAIVQGVGYPNPSRSHSRSMAIWHTARFDPEEHNGLGWAGRALDNAKPASEAPAALFLGAQAPPVAIRGRRSVTAALAHLDDFALADPGVRSPLGPAPAQDLAAFVHRSVLDAYTTADRFQATLRSNSKGAAYPATGLAQRLQMIARLLKSGLGARVYYTLQAGYDTHYNQLPTHADLLGEFSGAVHAFLEDLAAAGLAQRLIVLAFSEFGRRVEENAAAGTDHGTAGPVFLAGLGVKAGLVGSPPRLLDLEEGDLKLGIDFRRVYAAVLGDWLGLPAGPALGGTFERLPLFKT